MAHKAHPPMADRLRALREAFELGRQWGCTPAEAMERQAREAAKVRSQQALASLRAKIAVPLRRSHSPETTPAIRCWWND